MTTVQSTFAAELADRNDAFFFGRLLIRLFSPGQKNGLSILIFHRVLANKDPLFPDEVDGSDFDWQLRLLKSCFNVIALVDAIRLLREGKLPQRAACITFDDGYADNAEVALPILQSHQLTATFFIATGFLDGGRMWNDSVIELVRRSQATSIDASTIGLGVHPIETIVQRQAAIPALISQLKYLPVDQRSLQVQRLIDIVNVDLPENLMMTSAQVQQLHHAGMGIGGHTVNHPILAKTPDVLAKSEIANGKHMLEEIIGDQVRLFAYPNGKPGEDYLAQHVAMVKDLKFEGAVSTAWGSSGKNTNIFQLPRFTPWDRSRLRYVMRMAKNLAMDAAFV